MTVTFGCGHRHAMETEQKAAPLCPTCGEHRIRHVLAPAPRFRGAARGPSVQAEALPAVALDLAPGGPLKLKG